MRQSIQHRSGLLQHGAGKEGKDREVRTLVFNGQVMSDDRDTEFYQVLQGSRIHLLVESNSSSSTSDKPLPAVKVEEPQSPKFSILVKIPSSKRQFSLEANAAETVGQLKERIQESEGVPASRFVLFASGTELQDHRALGEYGGVAEHSAEINVVLKPFAPQSAAAAPAAAGTPASKKLRLMVLPKCGTRMIPVEVNVSDNVGELKELQRLHQQLHFHLPQEGYFFIYKQNVMDDDRIFRWREVRQRDTVEIFNGSVTGGS
ncbi:hypothetical protein ACLOJK_039429 [Asimina triloba]